jgi:hypothetical protein
MAEELLDLLERQAALEGVLRDSMTQQVTVDALGDAGGSQRRLSSLGQVLSLQTALLVLLPRTTRAGGISTDLWSLPPHGQGDWGRSNLGGMFG